MTQTAIAVWEPDQQEMDMYRRHYAPQNTTNDEWEIFLETCRAYRVSPIRRQIYLVGRYDAAKKRMVNTPQVSIGTLRLMALRTNEFEGTTEPEWADEEGNWHTCWPKSKGKHPYAARVGVYRKNFRTPVWGVVYFHEVAQTTKDNQGNKRYTKFWEDSGIHQLAKCAEADALRKAFEEECGGAYIHEEMLQADSDRPPVSVIPVVEEDDAETNDALKETAQAAAQPKEPIQPKAQQQPAKPALHSQGLYTKGWKLKLWKDVAGFHQQAASILGKFVNAEIAKSLTQQELEEIDAAIDAQAKAAATSGK